MAATLHVVAIITGQPGTGDQLQPHLVELAAATQHHEGCRHYALHRDVQDADVFVTVEEWTDEAALQAHLETPDVQDALGGPAGRLLATAPRIIAIRPVEG